MAEEQKQETKSQGAPKALRMLIMVIVGLALLVLGIFWGWIWRSELISLIKACIGPFAFLAGVITLLIAKE